MFLQPQQKSLYTFNFITKSKVREVDDECVDDDWAFREYY